MSSFTKNALIVGSTSNNSTVSIEFQVVPVWDRRVCICTSPPSAFFVQNFLRSCTAYCFNRARALKTDTVHNRCMPRFLARHRTRACKCPLEGPICSSTLEYLYCSTLSTSSTSRIHTHARTHIHTHTHTHTHTTGATHSNNQPTRGASRSHVLMPLKYSTARA